MSTNRREVLLAGLMLSMSWSAVSTGVSHGREQRLLRLIGEGESAKSIGEAYLRVHPESRPVIADSISAALGVDETAVLQTPLAELESRIKETIRKDFALGRTVRVEGWTLSLTESRICALYALAA